MHKATIYKVICMPNTLFMRQSRVNRKKLENINKRKDKQRQGENIKIQENKSRYIITHATGSSGTVSEMHNKKNKIENKRIDRKIENEDLQQSR